MKVLDKLRIPTENGDDFPTDSDRDYDEDYREEGVLVGPDEDDPRRDPAPGEAPKRAARAAARPRTEPPRVTKKHKDDAAEEIATFLQAIALAWGWQAPPCGDALEAAAPDIAEKVTKLLARNPRWLMKVREGGMLADAVGIAIAFKPVVTVAWQHYSAPAGGDEGDGHTFNPADFPAYRA